MRQEYAIYTPSMDEMITTIGNWIDQRTSGGYIYGPSRFGKSRTVKWYVRIVLEERFKRQLPLVVWSRPPTMMLEGDFWNFLLKASKFHFQNPEKPKKRLQARFLFKQQLITIARSARQNFIVLMIDEAHDVTLNEWKWLLGLQNELDDEGFRLTIFSIGSHQISYQPNYLARVGSAHIAARFFAVSAKFHGIKSINELAYILNGYDVDSEWPANTGTSYLKYFAPFAFEQNCRLTDRAADLWLAFEELLPPELKSGNKSWKMEIPMQHVALTMEQVLRLLARGKGWDSATSVESFMEIAASTGFTNHLRIIAMPE